MMTLVVTESNGEWPYVDWSHHETASCKMDCRSSYGYKPQ
jgi:hypothetical protein